MIALLTAGGFLWFLAALANTTAPALIAVGQIVATVPLAFIVHLLLAFPSGRVSSRPARALVIAGYAVCLALQAPNYLFGRDDPPYDVLQIEPRPDLVALGQTVQSLAGLAVMVATSVLLVSRWRSAEARHRRVLGPLYVYGVLTVLAEPLSARLFVALKGDPSLLVVTQLVLALLVPTVFAWCVLRGGFARTQEVEELATWLGTAGSRPRIEQALAGALGDPTLEVAYASDGLASQRFSASERADRSPSRDVVEVMVAGKPVAWISYDATLIAERDQVAAAGRVVAIELDRERLTTELLSPQQRAGGVAQPHLAGRGRDPPTDGPRPARRPPGAAGAALPRRRPARPDGTPHGRRHRRRRSAADRPRPGHLRPATTGAGTHAGSADRAWALAAADDLLDVAPFRVDLTLVGSDQGLPPQVESAAYFVVAEALSNAMKHSSAEHLWVSIRRSPTHLTVDVRDDGRGGAEMSAGTGLRGIADRLDAVGGSLRVGDAPGGGTRLVAEVPCAS